MMRLRLVDIVQKLRQHTSLIPPLTIILRRVRQVEQRLNSSCGLHEPLWRVVRKLRA